MPLPGRLIDGPSYTGLIETLVGMTIKLEAVRLRLDPIEDATSANLIVQIIVDATKAAAFARINPAEWDRVSDRMLSVLTIKPN